MRDERQCSGTFIRHTLDHITTVPSGNRVRMFEANGGGVAINDLDNDGDMDIVLANHAGKNTILWNEGGLAFRTEHLPHGESRAVTVVDVDGDGWLDLFFTRTEIAPTYMHNDGKGGFLREFVAGLAKPLYAINWADMDGDGDLDLAGATYDASLLTDFGQDFLMSGNGGVYYYENDGGRFQVNALATSAQALALALVDVNGDGHLDIWVGNDFAVPDQVWYWTETGFEPETLLQTMSHSTMSLDFGDINNDGSVEVFSTDMKPYEDDAQGQVVMPDITRSINEGRNLNTDPQVTENVLQTIGSFTNTARTAGVDATGWSWSGKFGDLDQDGYLDLYVVNGFAEMGTFPDLPNHELVEANQAFKNTGDGQFELMPSWGLGSDSGGRGMSMADMDGDGDLDIVVNNLRAPAELFENQLCEGSRSAVDLRWVDSLNTRAIGANLTLTTDAGIYRRTVKASSGYLSGDPSQIHFGYPTGTVLQQLTIEWPDGTVSEMVDPATNALIEVTRTDRETTVVLHGAHMDDTNQCLHAQVYGQVQGVSFRFYTQLRAKALAVTGWVRNRSDGSVEVTARGSRKQLEELLVFLQRGSPAANVIRVEVNWLVDCEEFSEFSIR
ncbi:MAG: FG-GAP-like repeat-containing protein [Chloroflexi bacterium]|nr:FG-GAP-like repeat-containing protein [Chloroflexota bacterium]MCC6895692.1 VCBS repeat-containing protein [Anaerolineae bacterium]